MLLNFMLMWTVLCEVRRCPHGDEPLFQRARLHELRLAFPGKRVWHFTGLARVAQLNWHGVRQVLLDNPDVVVCSDVP